VKTEGKDLLSFILDALLIPGPVWVDLIIGIVVVGGAWYWLSDIEDHVFYHSEVGKRQDLPPRLNAANHSLQTTSPLTRLSVRA
jgi:hypothetical protein